VDLSSILQLEPVGEDQWRAWSPETTHRPDNFIFGGQVAAQALRAATLTVDPEHRPNSVHGYFLRRGQSNLPLDIYVERVRAGRTYTSRRVDIRQEDKTIFAMLASFHADEPGPEFDHPMPGGIPDPDSLPESVDGEEGFGWWSGVEIRHVMVEGPCVQWWGRVRPPFSVDPVMHYCALLYESDLRAMGAAAAAIGFAFPDRPPRDPEGPWRRNFGNFGSLDHALWYHRTPVVDDWIFCDVQALTVRDSRGLLLGRMFDAGGRHVATFTQEAFLKLDGLESAPGFTDGAV
jgi:acyl-CoA thioesterase-2